MNTMMFSSLLLSIVSCMASPEQAPQTPGVRLFWNRIPGAVYCLTVRLKSGQGVDSAQGYTETIENFADAEELGDTTSYHFTGLSPSRHDIGEIGLEAVEGFEVNAAISGKWDEESLRNATYTHYRAGNSAQLRFPIIIRWNEVPNAIYRINVVLKEDQRIVRIADGLDGQRLYYVFDGKCDTMDGGHLPGFDEIAAFEVHAAINGYWNRPEACDQVRSEYDGRSGTVFLDFPSSPLHGLRSRRVQKAIADPDIYDDGKRFILSGTNEGDTTLIPFWTAPNDASPSEASFAFLRNYSPNDPQSAAYDSDYKYFYVWGPELDVDGDTYSLYFSAMRVPRTASDPEPSMPAFVPPVNDTVTVFVATGKADLDFGPPQPLDYGPGLPGHTLDEPLWQTSGDPMKMKLDAMPVRLCERPRVFYTWFHEGNHIASFDPASPEKGIIQHADPTFPRDEHIIEAPDVITRGRYYYLFYSAGHFVSQYRIEYIMGEQLDELRKDRCAVHALSVPVMRSTRGNARLLRNAGHCSIVEHSGSHYIFYHQGYGRDGRYAAPRDTFVAPLKFKEDGTLYRLSY